MSLASPVLRACYQAADPCEALGPNDQRFVQLDLARRHNPLLALAKPAGSGDDSRSAFITAQPGSGLSTELRVLQHRLEHAARPWVVAMVSMRLYTEVSPPTETIEQHMLALLVATRRVVSLDGGPLPAGIWRAARSLGALAAHEASENDASTHERFLRDVEWRRRVCFRLHAEFDAALRAVHDERAALQDRARAAGFAGVATLVDDVPNVYTAVGRMFRRDWEERQRRQGVPTAAMPRARREAALSKALHWFDEVQRLPMPGLMVWTAPLALAVHARTRAAVGLLPYLTENPVRAELVRRRLPHSILADLAAPGAGDSLVELIARWSLGSPRRLVEGARRVMELGRRVRVTAATLGSALRSVDEGALHAVDRATMSWAAKAAALSDLAFDDDVATATWLLARGAIVLEGASQRRVSLHPMLRQILPDPALTARGRGELRS